jgi:hypothetical protein
MAAGVLVCLKVLAKLMFCEVEIMFSIFSIAAPVALIGPPSLNV